MARIRCPEETCGKSNRARRKTCGQCGTPIAHLRVVAEPQPVGRGWPANGTDVSIIRYEHGWLDGKVSGVLISEGVVRGEDGYEYEINRPSDIYVHGGC